MLSSVPDRLIDEAVKFHGHLGAFLVLGLKAGLFANKVLGKDPFETRAIVETEPVPPLSCFIDGVQISTGCTMGKGNIKLRRGSSLSVTFTKKGKRLRLCLKDDVLGSLGRASSRDESRQAALTFVNRPILELFDVEE